ncbi:MAG: hypothetical protein FJ125_18285 [Deltaproteobacteria bacterium]|nr:hypothetical protein [Deltaproteobacteria bacterium]
MLQPQLGQVLNGRRDVLPEEQEAVAMKKVSVQPMSVKTSRVGLSVLLWPPLRRRRCGQRAAVQGRLRSPVPGRPRWRSRRGRPTTRAATRRRCRS